jgi:hypothetical protein
MSAEDRTSIAVKRSTLAVLAKKRISEGYTSYDEMLQEELIK